MYIECNNYWIGIFPGCHVFEIQQADLFYLIKHNKELTTRHCARSIISGEIEK